MFCFYKKPKRLPTEGTYVMDHRSNAEEILKQLTFEYSHTIAPSGPLYFFRLSYKGQEKFSISTENRDVFWKTISDELEKLPLTDRHVQFKGFEA